MRDVKFSCPHCAQHIVCDEAYCRHAIQCPACGQGFFVPPLAAFTGSTGGRLKLITPVGSKDVFQPQIPTLDPWKEGEWNRHFAETTGEEPATKSAIWLLLVAPFPLLLALRGLMGLQFGGLVICLLLSVLAAGFVWAGLLHKTGLQFAVYGLLLSMGLMVAYVGVAFAILFAGCVLL